VPTLTDYFGGLSDAMAVRQFNWCDRCEVFAVHEHRPTNTMGVLTGDPSFYVPRGGRTGFADHFDRWKICHASSKIETWLGSSAPEPFLNITSGCEACPLLHYSAGGICEPCPAGSVPRGDHCEPCDGGTVPDPNTNLCAGCGRYEITQGNSCVACPVGQVADRATNTCVLCPPDLTIDLATFASCSSQTFITPPVSSGTDACPDQTWVDVINLSASGGCTGYAGVGIDVGVEGQAGLGEFDCPLYSASLEVFDPAFQTLFSGNGPGDWFAPPLGISTCRFPSMTSITTDTINAGLEAVRLRVSAERRVPFPEAWPVQLTVTEVGGVN
jgi:hypothetical protein